MKNNRIRIAYDSINPSLSDKHRMLDAILAEAHLDESVEKKRKNREPIVYTQKQPGTTRRRNVFTPIAATVALFLVTGIAVFAISNRQPIFTTEGNPPAETAAVIKTAKNHYAPVLEKYRRAASEGWTKEQCEIEGISTRMQAGFDFSKAGYALLDLDGDGREELLIAEESTDRTDNIWDFYTTLEDGTPIQLWIDEQDGGQCRLYEDNVISISYSYKHELELTFYDLKSGNLVMREMLQWEDEDTVFHTDVNGITSQVTSREGQEIGYSYENQKLNLTWLSDIPEHLRDTDIVERYEPVLEKYKTALLENWTWEQCDTADISRMILFDTTNKNNLGWCLLDLDNNGTEELIISDGETLIDMYCFVPENAQPEDMIRQESNMDYFLSCTDGICHVIKSDASMSYTLYENGILRLQHIKPEETGWCFYQFHSKGMKLEGVLKYTPHHSAVTVVSGYQYGSDTDNLTSISKDEAGEILFRYAEKEVKLTPFVEKDFKEVKEPNYYYEPLIETYRQAIRENWNPGQCMENGISLMIGYYGELYDTLGQNQIDLNGDGNDELIITDGKNIYDLYTIVSDKTVGAFRVINATERSQYFLTKDGYIYSMGSGSALVSYHSLYSLGQRELVFQKGYVMDADADSNNPWFYYDGENKTGTCPTSEAASAIDAIYFEEISFIPFQ